MRITRRMACSWFVLTGALSLVLPALNLLSRDEMPAEFNAAYLFNTDLVEGAAALALYKAGVSLDPDRVVVGKEGWLFLGDRYESIVRHTRGIPTASTRPKRTREIAGNLRANQDWIKARATDTLFVIAPNKYSIYPEYRPAWMERPETSFTDQFVAEAEARGVQLLDLRPVLLEAKTPDIPLYYKLDSHWNLYGAYLGYRAMIRRLDLAAEFDIEAVARASIEKRPTGGGGTAKLLKLNPLLPAGSDWEVDVALDGPPQTITVQSLDRDTMLPTGEAWTGPNRRLAVGRGPYHLVNDTARNDLRVLWLRDSFGNYNSHYIHATFGEIWAVHLGDCYGAALERFIRRAKPDLVLYQVVERSIHGDILRVPIPDAS